MLTRKRRKIKEPYRINDIRQQREQPQESDFDHNRHSEGKRRRLIQRLALQAAKLMLYVIKES